jgi:1,4-alpha-glucan branching enzyme
MSVRYAVSLVLNIHHPYIKEIPAVVQRDPAFLDEIPVIPENINLAPESAEESWFFETLSETYLPLLMLFDRLEADHVPFRLGISLSPIMAQMLCDDLLQKKYIAYLDHQIDFGKQEIERLDGKPALRQLAQYYFDQAVERRAAMSTRYEGNLFKALEQYQQKNKIEFLAAPATHAFLPFLCSFPEALQAQIETALAFYHYSLDIVPQGFWLPELGWSKELDPFLRSYNFNYTIVDSHGFVLGNPPPSRGSFFPVRTPQNIIILARDFYACSDINRMSREGPYRDNSRDVGYELPIEMLSPFIAQNGARCQTGYKYWQTAGGAPGDAADSAPGDDIPYDPAAARETAEEHARAFLENCCGRLESARRFMKELPLSLCAFNADNFGRHWHEGPQFLESLFRLAAGYRELQFMTPAEYLYQQPLSAFEVSLPEYSSWGDNGYAEVWLDSSNDWIYRHLSRSISRMTELADRFSGSSNLKERTMNQAACELLLAMASDWPALLYRQECTGYARRQLEDPLQNFTTIYEALGSNYISTEWLTTLERRHSVFPQINYHVFKRKQ